MKDGIAFLNNSTTKLLAQIEKMVWLDGDLDFYVVCCCLCQCEKHLQPVCSACQAAVQCTYEGRAALPHPPAIVTWTHIKPQPPLKCCNLQQHDHCNPNIRRHLAVKSGQQFKVRHYDKHWPHQTSSGEHMEDLLCCQHYSWFSECNLNLYITVT